MTARIKHFLANPANIIRLVFIISVVFYMAIAFDLTPLLRGPADSIIESRWPYYFVDTFSKIWIFIPIFIWLVWLTKKINEANKINAKTELIILALIVVLTFSFQIALVYFSRFGITILFRRFVDPGINGYFTTALSIDNVSDFLSTFPDIVNARTLSQHASGHPPGAVLLLRWLINLLSFTPQSQISFLNNIHPGWAKDLWNTLNIHQKFASIILPFILHLLSSLTVIPFYFVSKEFLKNSKVALKTTMLYAVIPSLSFFALIFDPIYAIFPLIATFLILIGVRTGQQKFFFTAGLACGIGLFFTAAVLTYIAGLTIFTLLSLKTTFVKSVINFLSGLLSVILIFFLLNFDLINSLLAVIHNQASRDYLPWLIYNPYDFFVFMGLPISIVFLIQTYLVIKQKITMEIVLTKLFATFWITFLILIISGASRGEVGRIWLLFMFVPILLVGNFINNSVKFGYKQYLILFTLLFVQTIVMEEFWVPIW